MNIFRNIMRFLRQCSLGEVVKFVLIAGLFVFVAFLLFKVVLVLIVIGILVRLIAPLFGFRFSGMKFKHHKASRFKIVGEEEKKQAKRKAE